MTEAAVAMQQVGTAAQAVVVALDWQSSPETRRNATAYLDSVRRPFFFSLGWFCWVFLKEFFCVFFSLAIFAPVASEFFLSLVAIWDSDVFLAIYPQFSFIVLSHIADQASVFGFLANGTISGLQRLHIWQSAVYPIMRLNSCVEDMTW
jgi:hypothetical protein